MSQKSVFPKRSDEIRREIDSTRQQLDQTIDALVDRFKGRHLVDEVIGVFRTQAAGEKAAQIKDKALQTTNSAVNSIVNSVKSNPWPAVLIGAGVAWMIYSSRQSSSQTDDEYLETGYEDELEDDVGYEFSGGGYGAAGVSGDYEADLTVGEGGEGAAAGLGDKLRNAKDKLGEKASEAKDQLQQKASEIGDRLRDSTENIRNRASELSSQLRDRSRQLYETSRERVTTTVNEHPLEVGLGVLALGVVAGLAIPTPRKIHEVVGPRVDRIRDRARQAGQDLVNRGRHVAEAAAQAARQEAQSQGITPDALKAKAGAVVDRTKEAAANTARDEGVIPGDTSRGGAQTQPAGQQVS